MLIEENSIVVSNRVSENRWNDALKKAYLDGTLFQSTFWAEYIKKVHEDEPIYLLSIDKKGEINGQLLAFQSVYGNFPIFNYGTSTTFLGTIKSKLYKIFFKKIFRTILPFIYWQNGPIIHEYSCGNHSVASDKVYVSLIKEILKICKERKIYSIRLARPAYFMDHYQLMELYGFKKRKMGTVVVDLRRSPEIIWKSFRKDARYAIKKTEDKLTYSEARSLRDLRIFYDLLVQLTKRLGIKAYPFHHYESLWNFFQPLGKLISFVAFFKDMPMGANIVLTHNKIAHIYMYADSEFARANKIYVNDALIWHTIKWANARNFKYLDLSGVFFYKIYAGDKKAYNIFKFKSKFGETINFNDYWKETDRSFLRLRLKCTKILNPFLKEGSGCFTY